MTAPPDAQQIIQHLINALDQAHRGRWHDVQRSIEYAAGRLWNTLGEANISLYDLQRERLTERPQ
jgi:hypothetical protein